MTLGTQNHLSQMKGQLIGWNNSKFPEGSPGLADQENLSSLWSSLEASMPQAHEV